MKKSLSLMFLALVLAPQVVLAVPVSAKVTKRAAVRAERSTEIKAKIEELRETRTQDKEAATVKVLSRVKAKALAEIERVLGRFEKMNNRVQKMSVISEDRKLAFSTAVEMATQNIGEYKAKVEAAGNVTEVRTVMDELRKDLKANYRLVKDIVSIIHATHLENIIKKLETILTTLKSKAGTGEANLELIAEAEEGLKEARVAIEAKDFKTARASILVARKSMVVLAQNVKAETGEEETEESASTTTTTVTTTTVATEGGE